MNDTAEATIDLLERTAAILRQMWRDRLDPERRMTEQEFRDAYTAAMARGEQPYE